MSNTMYETDPTSEVKSLTSQELERYKVMRDGRNMFLSFDFWGHKPYSIVGTRIRYIGPYSGYGPEQISAYTTLAHKRK